MPNRKRTVALTLQIFLDPASQPIRLPFLISGRVQSRALRFWEIPEERGFFVSVNARFAVANAPTVMIVEDNLKKKDCHMGMAKTTKDVPSTVRRETAF